MAESKIKPVPLMDCPIKMGYLIPMKNVSKKQHERSAYYALKVEDATGAEKSEEWLLFTQKEFDSMNYIDGKEFASLLKPGRMIRCAIDEKPCRVVMMSVYSVATDEWFDVVIRLSDSMLEKGRARKKRKPECVPEQSLFRDMMD